MRTEDGGDRAKVPTKTVVICMIVNARLTAVSKYNFLPVIQIMDIAPVVSNNSVNQGCNYLVLTLRHYYLFDRNPCNNLRKSVDYVPKIIV